MKIKLKESIEDEYEEDEYEEDEYEEDEENKHDLRLCWCCKKSEKKQTEKRIYDILEKSRESENIEDLSVGPLDTVYPPEIDKDGNEIFINYIYITITCPHSLNPFYYADEYSYELWELFNEETDIFKKNYLGLKDPSGLEFA